MILQCPSCATRFMVDSALIPPEGREVRCAKCGHMWHATGAHEVKEEPPAPPAEEMPPPASEDIAVNITFGDQPAASQSGEAYNMPSATHASTAGRSSPLPPMLLAAGLAIFLLGLALLYLRPQMPPALDPLYAALGMPSSEGMALADVVFRQRPAKDKTHFVVEGSIVNESQEERRIPILKVTLADAQDQAIVSREYEADATLKPGESYPFKATKLDTVFADKVDHIVVEIGNGTELILRNE